MTNKFDPSTFQHKQIVKEEITDIIEDIQARYTPENFEAMEIKKGKVLRFNYEGSMTTLRITRVAFDKTLGKKRYWAVHTELHEQKIVRSHYGHDVDSSKEPPFCNDCEVPVTEPSTEDGEKKYKDREDRYLSDGTPINETE